MALIAGRVREWVIAALRGGYFLYLAGRDKRVPILARAVSAACAAYVLAPINLIPDEIPVIGELDDALVLLFGIILTRRLIPDPLLTELRAKAAERFSAMPSISTLDWVRIKRQPKGRLAFGVDLHSTIHRSRGSLNRLSRSSRLLLVAAIWVGILFVEVSNWGAGGTEAVALLLLLAGICVLTVSAQPSSRLDAAGWSRALLIACGALFAVQLGFLAKQIVDPHLIDVATTTLAAGQALLAGSNPYTLPLDAEALRITGDPALQGYKYLPLMAITYLPFGSSFGLRGVLLTNLALQVATVCLIYRLGVRIAARHSAGLVAVLFYLSLPLALRQVFGKGATDLAAVVPLLAALLTFERRPALAGFCVGLSVSAKLLPGALLAPCALPPVGRRWEYLGGVVVGLVPALVFVALSPEALFNNIILFSAARAPDSTSWLAFAPAAAQSVMRALLVGSLAAVCLFVWRHAPNLASRCGMLAGITLVAILSGPAAHHNYHLWWLPLVSVLVGAVAM